MPNPKAIDIAVEALALEATYGSSKQQKLDAISGLANYVRHSVEAAKSLVAMSQYSSDSDVRRAAFDALARGGAIRD
jgi:hypothetical protein